MRKESQFLENYICSFGPTPRDILSNDQVEAEITWFLPMAQQRGHGAGAPGVHAGGPGPTVDTQLGASASFAREPGVWPRAPGLSAVYSSAPGKATSAIPPCAHTLRETRPGSPE